MIGFIEILWDVFTVMSFACYKICPNLDYAALPNLLISNETETFQSSLNPVGEGKNLHIHTGVLGGMLAHPVLRIYANPYRIFYRIPYLMHASNVARPKPWEVAMNKKNVGSVTTRVRPGELPSR